MYSASAEIHIWYFELLRMYYAVQYVIDEVSIIITRSAFHYSQIVNLLYMLISEKRFLYLSTCV
jgi:hypothetical protein